MPTCPCGKDFHACSSCGLNNEWEYKYCCEDHWKKYDKDYNNWRGKFRALHRTINAPQRIFLMELLTECPSDYESEFEEWRKEL